VPEPPAGRPFTGAALDRVSVQRKDPAWVQALAAAPDARGVIVGRDAVLVDPTGAALARISATSEQLGDPILLGVSEDGAGLFAIDLEQNGVTELL
jgi:hypothetical protein